MDDKDLKPSDVQTLSSADGVASFFAALGYDVDSRLPQTTAALGITTESLQRQIKSIEQIAVQENGAEPLYVYLIEMTSVTVAATQGLARALRNRVGNYLSRKINDIDRAGFLDVSVLGETVHPRNFNTLRRIMGEDGSVTEEQEQFTELASNEFLLQQLRNVLESGAREMLENLPDGIHSGLAREGESGVFFYFTSKDSRDEGQRHFWRYYDLNRDRILDNRFLIMNMIACSQDTPRVIGDCDIFKIQDKVIEDILKSVQEQQAIEAAPKIVDPIQQTVLTLLRGYLNSPAIARQDVRSAMQQVSHPMTHVAIRELRSAFHRFSEDQNIHALIESVNAGGTGGSEDDVTGQQTDAQSTTPLRRDDLHLVCFDYVCS